MHFKGSTLTTIFLSALFTASIADAGIVHVSNDVAMGTSSTSSLKMAVKAVAANDLMVVGISYCCSTSAPKVSDNKGNTWHLVKQVSDTTRDTIALYYAVASIAGSTVVTVSPNSEQYIGASFSEYSGVNPSQPTDGNAAGRMLSNTATADSGPVTPSQAGDLLVTIAYNDNDPNHSPGSGFIRLAEPNGDEMLAAEYQIDSSVAPTDGKVVFTTVYNLPAIMQAFAPSGSVSTTTTTTLPSVTTTTIKTTTTTTTLPSSGGNPTTGAHAMAYYMCGSSGLLQTSPINTAAFGSTVLAWTGRGTISEINSANEPQTNYSSNGAPVQIGSTEPYTPYYPDSGEAVYGWAQYSGGNSNVFSFPVPPSDEVSAVIVEVLNGGNIADYNFTRVVSGPNDSGTVTTTGPATLVAIWAGDSANSVSYATPDSGFTVIESQSKASCDVEVTVATKDVSSAGTYSVNWTPNVDQGAHLWLIAIQKK